MNRVAEHDKPYKLYKALGGGVVIKVIYLKQVCF